MRYIWVALIFMLIACDSSRIYEDYEDMEEAFWHMDSVKRFSFEIEDSTATYNLLATFRNASLYPFYNIYFQYTLTDSLDSTIVQQLTEANLFDPQTGQPYGSGLGDMFDHSVPLMENYSFPSVGSYSLKLQQFMRMDSLPFIMSVGARVELAGE